MMGRGGESRCGVVVRWCGGVAMVMMVKSLALLGVTLRGDGLY